MAEQGTFFISNQTVYIVQLASPGPFARGCKRAWVRGKLCSTVSKNFDKLPFGENYIIAAYVVAAILSQGPLVCGNFVVGGIVEACSIFLDIMCSSLIVLLYLCIDAPPAFSSGKL